MFTLAKDLPKALPVHSSVKPEELPAYMPKKLETRFMPKGFVAPKQPADLVSRTTYRNKPILQGQSFDVLMPDGKTVLKDAKAIVGTYLKPVTPEQVKAFAPDLDPQQNKAYLDNPYQIVDAVYFLVVMAGMPVLVPATRVKLRLHRPTKAERNLARVRRLKEKAKKLL